MRGRCQGRTVEEEQDSALRTIPSRSKPMQLCVLRKDVREDFLLLLARPLFVCFGRGETKTSAKHAYVPLLAQEVSHGGHVERTSPRPPLVCLEDTGGHRERYRIS